MMRFLNKYQENYFKILTLICMLLLFAAPAQSAPGKEVGWLNDAKGSVSIQREGEMLSAKIGMQLQELDTIITGAKSYARIEMQGGDEISLGYRSKIVISEYQLNKNKEIVTAGFKALFGKFMFAVEKLRSRDAYRINTHVAVLGVRGTKWYALVEAEKTEVAGIEGFVSVTAADMTKVVGAGESVVATLAGVGAVIATPAIFLELFMQQGVTASLTGAAAGSTAAVSTAGISTTALVGGAVAAGGIAAVASGGGGSSGSASCANSYAGSWVGTSTVIDMGNLAECNDVGGTIDPISMVVDSDCSWAMEDDEGALAHGSVDPTSGTVAGASTDLTGDACGGNETMSGILNASTGSGIWSDESGEEGTWELTKQGSTPSPSTVPSNNPPVAVDDSASTTMDISMAIDVLSNDSDADGDALSILSVASSSVGGGSVLVNSDQTLSYAPASGFSGTDSFTYTVSDGHGGSATATVSVSVMVPAAAPTGANDFLPNVNQAGFPYLCSGTCNVTGVNGISSTNLSVSGNQVILSSFHNSINGSPAFINNVPGSNQADSQSNNLRIMGGPGASCSLSRFSNIEFDVSCQNNSGSSCLDFCQMVP
ncbi:MAG: Ig-like domain-containing protein [Mariprofundaceae bacterium]